MLTQLLGLLPDAVNALPVALAAGIAVAGAPLAIFGAKHSRAIMTLALVATGTYVGLRLPKWLGWTVDPMGTAFAAAILLGITGYVLTTLWEALFLSVLLASIGGAAVWIALAFGATWQWPQIDWSATAVDSTLRIYHSIPIKMSKELPAAVVIGIAVGMLLPSLWPRLGRILLYGVGGLAALVLCGAIAMRHSQPDTFAKIPSDPRIQGGVFAGLLLISICVQWRSLRAPGKAKLAANASEPNVAPATAPSKKVRPDRAAD